MVMVILGLIALLAIVSHKSGVWQRLAFSYQTRSRESLRDTLRERRSLFDTRKKAQKLARYLRSLGIDPDNLLSE
ncbi:hypothetical protein [Nostoc sp.]|uniref:hypothetical protein n=1 Tax=Nostoc sp. TaxID=1180 RepID=UPI002FF787B9